MKNITVSALPDLDIILNVSRAMFDSQGKLSVIVKKYERNISKEQQGLYFKWIGIIGGELGYTKDEMHQMYKEKFLLNIFMADPENHLKFKTMAADLKAIKTERPDRYQGIREYVMETISVMDGTVQNISDYLHEIENEARGLNIRLPMPELQGVLI